MTESQWVKMLGTSRDRIRWDDVINMCFEQHFDCGPEHCQNTTDMLYIA